MLEWLSFLVACATFLPDSVRSEPLVPCFFVFGDSLVDSGNNNVIASMARANYAPYGIDFPYGPTGRFSNGLTTVDVIGEFTYLFTHRLPTTLPYITCLWMDTEHAINVGKDHIVCKIDLLLFTIQCLANFFFNLQHNYLGLRITSCRIRKQVGPTYFQG